MSGGFGSVFIGILECLDGKVGGEMVGVVCFGVV